jgi:RNA polymerase sigma-70 factor (ECF subfamily)
VQPPIRRGRPITQPLRPDRPLDYGRLAEPIVITRAKDGDAAALAELCARHGDRVERLARHLLDDPEDARDAAQESLAKLCVRIRQFRGDARFSTWLHRLVVNTCRDVAARRRARPWEQLVEDERAATTGDPAHALQLSELRRELCAHLREIPADQAKVVVLKDALELSFEEISTAESMPVGTAKCYAHRARARLRARLEPV